MELTHLFATEAISLLQGCLVHHIDRGDIERARELSKEIKAMHDRHLARSRHLLRLREMVEDEDEDDDDEVDLGETMGE